MEGNFPQLSAINGTILERINSRIGNNLEASRLKPWIRIISSVGNWLQIESIPNSDNFTTRYGDYQKSGAIGLDINGKPVYAPNEKRGLRPSPTIDGLSVSNGSSGLSRKITFTITAYTLAQSEILLQYFQEPGYTLLVECGWNISESVAQKCGLDECEMISRNNLKKLTQLRQNSKGTYDAFLGYITGGGLKFGDGETFKIDVELTTIGEIPMYLQSHKGVSYVDPKDANSTAKDFEAGKIARTKDVGEALFMQMYNDLPNNKKTESVKKLMSTTDPRTGIKYSDAGNFVNMDRKIRDTLTDIPSGANIRKGDGTTTPMPEGVPLVSDERYIRLNLAFAIINTNTYEFKQVISPCETKDISNSAIETKYVICRAVPNMFSVDKTKLYIPNKNMPMIDIESAISPPEGDEIPPFINEAPFIGGGGTKSVHDIHPKTESDKGKTYFPDIRKLEETGDVETEALYGDSDYFPYVAKAGHWGYLENLFINYDFFLSVINKSGMLNKDIVLEICNGLSSAVNMYWDFQLVTDKFSKVKKSNGAMVTRLIDNSFCGRRVPNNKIPAFRSRGIDSPFLDCGLDFDIPGSMKNMIVGRRISSKVKSNPEGREIPLDGKLFASSQDKVLALMNSIKENTAKAINTEEDESAENPSEEEVVAANYAIFREKAGIFPAEQDPDGNIDIEKNWIDLGGDNSTVSDLLRVGVWEDSAFLSRLMGATQETPGEANGVILPIKFNFTIHGVSGLRIGDCFRIIDIPKYSTKQFQIMQIEHAVDDSNWVTKVQAQIRNTNG